MIAEKANGIKFHIDKSHTEEDKYFRLSRLKPLIADVVNHLVSSDTEVENKLWLINRSITFHDTNALYGGYAIKDPALRMLKEWLAYRWLSVPNDVLNNIVARVFNGYAETLEQIILECFEIEGVMMFAPEPITVSKNPKSKSDIPNHLNNELKRIYDNAVNKKPAEIIATIELLANDKKTGWTMSPNTNSAVFSCYCAASPKGIYTGTITLTSNNISRACKQFRK